MIKYIYLLVLVLFAQLSLAQSSDKWWHDAVFYEIFVRSFYDSNGDGKGDFQGMTEKLDYLNDGDPNTDTDLGVTGIWLMPICPSPSYHGYDVVDYRDVDLEYGTMNDFKAFLDEAHTRGIKVIIDYVFNHSSSQHPWFLDSRSSPGAEKRDWYTWEDTNPGYTGPWGQQVWHPWGGDYYLGIFWGGMPDLNLEDQEVVDEIFDIAKFWLEEVGVDGFRCDAIKHLFEDGPIMENVPENYIFLEEFHDFYKSVNPDALTVGEAWTSSDQVVNYIDDKMDICFEFDLAYSIINSVNGNNPQPLFNTINTVINTYPPNQYATFLTNHDQNRIFEQFGNDVHKMKLAASLYLTLPGVPFLYYGEEVGMIGSGPDENKRKPMQWIDGPNAGFTSGSPWYSINSNYPNYNVATMQADPNSLWNHYQMLIELRNNYKALRKGNLALMSASTSNNLLAYTREHEGNMVLVAHNLTAASAANPGFQLNSSFLLPGDYEVVDLITSNIVGSISIDNNGGVDWTYDGIIGARESKIFHIGSLTSTQQIRSFEGLAVFPNPAQDELFLTWEADEKIASVKVFNTNGQVVIDLQHVALISNQYNLSIAQLPAGSYFIQLQGDKGQDSRKFVKQE